MTKNVTVVVGGQAGSEAKGKVAGYLAKTNSYAAAINNFMPNAGHTWVDDDGNKHMVQQLPMAVVDGKSKLIISAGSAICLNTLHNELQRFACFNARERLLIHPRAVVITDSHREYERSLVRISSTMKGCGAALGWKAMRHPETILAKDCPELRQFVDYGIHDYIHFLCDAGYPILLEGAQGFDLDINHGLEYPQCTSRQTNTMQLLADVGIPYKHVGRVIAVIRPYPIRVGNNYNEHGQRVGYSGDYGDACEISWETVASRSGYPLDMLKKGELTTVTGKLRRVFEMEWGRLSHMVWVNDATELSLQFANYIDASMTTNVITPKVYHFVREVEIATGLPVKLIGYGPRNGQMVNR